MNKSDYTLRIANSDPLGLVIITYELINKHISQAQDAQKDSLAKQNTHKARQFLNELMISLNMSEAISRDLMSIYIYVNKLLIEAGLSINRHKFAQAKGKLAEAFDIMTTLGEGWQAIRNCDVHSKGQKLIENSQQLYAGLTYKDGKLTEFIDEESGRDFKA